MGGAIGALAGLLLHRGAILTQQRVLLGQQYYFRKYRREAEAANKEREKESKIGREFLFYFISFYFFLFLFVSYSTLIPEDIYVITTIKQ